MRHRFSFLAVLALIASVLVAVPPASAEEPDVTAPQVSFQSPAADAVVEVGQEVPAVFACTDPEVAGALTSGVATCFGMVTQVPESVAPDQQPKASYPVQAGELLDTSQPGQFEVAVTTEDDAGNAGSGTVRFTVVGVPEVDSTGPQIEITAPADGASVKVGGVLEASYACWDEESAVEACEGTVPSGAAVDTSAVGTKEFTVEARDAAGNTRTKTVTYEVIPKASVTVSGEIQNLDGQVVPGATVQARLAGTSDVVASTEANTNGYYSLTLPEGTYDLRYRASDGTGANLSSRELLQDKTINVTLGLVPVEVSGAVPEGVVGSLWYGSVSFSPASGSGSSAWSSVGADGRFSLLVVPGEYSASVYLSGEHGSVSVGRRVSVAEDMTVDLVPSLTPLTVNLLDADGAAASGSVSLSCNSSGAEWWGNSSVNRQVSGVGVLSGLAASYVDENCTVSVTFPGGVNLSQRIRVDADQPNALTIFTFGGGIVIDGGTDDTNDGDNVADAVEALAPNEGDGNGDGVKDYEQQNVTSLPVNGGELGGGQSYVTVAAPEGVELSNVYTIPVDDSDRIETPPPAGVTLPEGLTNMVLKGVETGSDQVISVYTASTENVSGYAKYNPNTKQWSLLPEDRVAVYNNRVEIRLTDGGIGDDDGEANGRISDPGGIAIIENLDEAAPAVTGQIVQEPNAEGWFRDDVTVRWTATDPEPSAGQPAAPADTTVSGEGIDLRAVSDEVCDAAGNCSTGVVEGIRIDRTEPAVSISGVRDGQTYTLGAVPAATCSASDALSGLSGVCEGTLTGGNANGVGDFTYEAKAVDRAGNTHSVSVSYKVVYRFDGFMQPINDPVAKPGAPRSVFKSGSTLPVKFQLKRADGSVVAPIAVPLWVTPERGTATSATVNEEAWSEAASSGSAFVLTEDHWQYNWKTKGVAAGYNHRIGVKLDDGTTHYVVVAAR